MRAIFEQIKANIPEPIHKAIRIVKILVNDMNRCDLFKHATAMAYVTLFSLIPSLAATFALISVFKPFMGEDSALIVKVKSYILSNLATGSGEQLINYLEGFLANLDMAKIGITGFAGMLVTLVMLLRQIEIALNRIWLVQNPRHIVIRFIYFWTFLTLGTFLVGLAVGIVSGGNLGALNPFADVEVDRNFFMSIAPYLATTLFFTMLYKFVPNTFVSARNAFAGAIFSAVMFYAAGGIYSWYGKNFTNYQAIYGALAALPIFLMWLYIVWLITLFGSLLAWRLQQTFHLSDDMDDEKLDLTPTERLRNHSLQAMTPYLSLIAIYQQFALGEGKGVTGHQIATKLNIPSPWISEALSALLQFGFVGVAEGDPEDSGDLLMKEYFPKYPADKIAIKDVFKSMNAATNDWLESWQHEWPVDVKPAIRAVWQSNNKEIADDSLDYVIKQLKPLGT